MQIPLAPHAHASKITAKDTAAARGELSERQAAMQGSKVSHTSRAPDELRAISRMPRRSKGASSKAWYARGIAERVGISRGMAWWLESGSERCSPPPVMEMSDFVLPSLGPHPKPAGVTRASTSASASGTAPQHARTASRGFDSRKLRSRDALDIFFDASRESTPAGSSRRSARGSRGASRKSSSRASSSRSRISRGGRDVPIPGAKGDAVLKRRASSRGSFETDAADSAPSRDAADSHAMNQASSSPMLIPSGLSPRRNQVLQWCPPRKQMSTRDPKACKIQLS